jgi:hypothetical protein
MNPWAAMLIALLATGSLILLAVNLVLILLAH